MLNIGLAAGILDTRTFSMFVVHALILTIMTTPLTLAFYPPKYRTRDAIHATDKQTSGGEAGVPVVRASSNDDARAKFSFILDKIEQLPAAMTLAQLLQMNISPNDISHTISDEKIAETSSEYTDLAYAVAQYGTDQRRVKIDALRLIELTTRTSAVLKSQEVDSFLYNDPVVSVFKTFGYLNRLLVSATLSVVSYDEFPEAIAKHARESSSEMVVIPWSRGTTSAVDEGSHASVARNPFDGIFHKTTTQDQTSSVVYSEFIRNVFLTSPTDVALFVDRGLTASSSTGNANQMLFLPFFGGPDDRLALSFLVQLCMNTSVQAHVVRIIKTEELTSLNSIDETKFSAVASAALHNVSFHPLVPYV